eukprot:9258-Eustigmatos_ZCMA.PRE.1
MHRVKLLFSTCRCMRLASYTFHPQDPNVYCSGSLCHERALPYGSRPASNHGRAARGSGRERHI